MSRTVHVTGGDGRYQEHATIGGHTLVFDEPVDVGGGDAGPTPREALLAALGACTADTLKLYAARKGWPVTSVDVTLELVDEPGKQAQIKKTVRIAGDLDDDQRARLQQISGKCPVQRILNDGAVTTSTFE